MPFLHYANTLRLHPQTHLKHLTVDRLGMARACRQKPQNQKIPSHTGKMHQAVVICHHIKRLWPLRIAELSVNLHRKASDHAVRKGAEIGSSYGLELKLVASQSWLSMPFLHYANTLRLHPQTHLKHLTVDRLGMARVCRQKPQNQKIPSHTGKMHQAVVICHHIKRLWPLRIAELSVNLHRKASDHAVRKGAEIGSS